MPNGRHHCSHTGLTKTSSGVWIFVLKYQTDWNESNYAWLPRDQSIFYASSRLSFVTGIIDYTKNLWQQNWRGSKTFEQIFKESQSKDKEMIRSWYLAYFQRSISRHSMETLFTCALFRVMKVFAIWSKVSWPRILHKHQIYHQVVSRKVRERSQNLLPFLVKNRHDQFLSIHFSGNFQAPKLYWRTQDLIPYNRYPTDSIALGPNDIQRILLIKFLDRPNLITKNLLWRWALIIRRRHHSQLVLPEQKKDNL